MQLSPLQSVSSSSIQFLQRTFYDTFTSLQQIVAIVALAALTALAAILAIKSVLNRRNVRPLSHPEINPINILVVTKEQKIGFAEGIKTFSFEMLNKLTGQQNSKNVMISPLSISLVLSMLKHGMSEKDQGELENILHLPKDEKELQESAHQLMEKLKASGFDIANLVYLNEKYRINPTYQQVVSQSYQSKVENGASAAEINAWVNEVTHGQIKEIVSQQDLNNFFVALLNAIHFKASWKNPFSADRTRPGDFQVTPSEKIQIDMMVGTEHVDYFENGQCQAIRLLYKDCDASMLLVLPEEGFSFSSIDEKLFDKVVNGMKKREVTMTLPKFDISYEIDLIPLLQSMGVSSLFEKPDFTPLVDTNHAPSKAVLDDGLVVDTIIQKSALKIDEKTTEASTATVIGIEGKCFRKKDIPKEIHFNRPFFAALIQGETPVLFSLINNPILK